MTSLVAIVLIIFNVFIIWKVIFPKPSGLDYIEDLFPKNKEN